MSLTIKALKKLKKLEKGIIHSHDLSLYTASVMVDGEEHTIVGDDKKPMRTYNKLEFQTLFARMNAEEIVLRQNSCYDEMIGHPPKGDNTMEVPLGNARLGDETLH